MSCLSKEKMQKIITLDVYNEKNEYMGEKRFYAVESCGQNLGKWIASFRVKIHSQIWEC